MSGLPRYFLRLIVPQPTDENSCGLGVFVPFFHSGGVAQLGEPLEKADELFSVSPVGLAECVSEVLSPGFGVVVGGGGFTDCEQQVT